MNSFLSASARPLVLCSGIEHQSVLGNIKIFLEGDNHNKQKTETKDISYNNTMKSAVMILPIILQLRTSPSPYRVSDVSDVAAESPTP